MLSFFLARRFFHAAGGDRRRRASALTIHIATAGVAIGLAVMLVSIMVVKGFQGEVRSKVAGLCAHVEVLDPQAFASPESYPIATDPDLIKKIQSVPGVEHVQRTALKMGILKTDDAFESIVIKGIGEDYDTAFLKSQIKKGRLPNTATSKPASASESESGESGEDDGETTSAGSNEILISQSQATALGLDVGSKVYTYFINDDIRVRRFTVVGIYETNFSQFDDNFVWTDRATVLALNAWDEAQSSELEVRCTDFSRIDEVQAAIGRLVNGKSDRFGGSYITISIKENPRTASVIQWLTLLDLNVDIIFLLMLCVAGFTTIGGLLILILERTQTIGTLKALGATNTLIRRTFIAYAALIVLRGMFWGNVLALGLCGAQRLWGFVKLNPQNYYVTEVPVTFDVPWIILLNVATLLVCVLALILPSYVISRIRPYKAMRFE